MFGASFHSPDNAVVELWMHILRVGRLEPDVAQLAKCCEDRKECGVCPAGASQVVCTLCIRLRKKNENERDQLEVSRQWCAAARVYDARTQTHCGGMVIIWNRPRNWRFGK